MSVRRATAEDLPHLLELARREHARSRFAGEPFDAHWVAQAMRQGVQGMLSCAFVSEAGFIAGVVQPGMLNRRFTAYEMAWYAEDGAGMKLLAAFTQWARSMRAVAVQVSNYAAIKDAERFARAMERAGFELLGMTFTKRLEG